MYYWDTQWGRRIQSDVSVEMNYDKMKLILQTLVEAKHYHKLRTLDIGCGTGIHAWKLREVLPEWVAKWTGIELSKVACDWGINNELDIINTSIEEYTTNDKFGLFLLLDVFEHIENEPALVKKIKELADEKFYVFGNIPLYKSFHEDGFERDVDINTVVNFCREIGCTHFGQHIYGVKGFPYMIFEGAKL